MYEVVIQKVETAGKFLCRPKASNELESDDYLEYVASLNTFYEKRKQDDVMLMLNQGDLCACFTSIGENTERLWYRGQIISWFQSTAGLIAKVLLVDEGDVVCVTKQRMRQLDPRFVKYPSQVIQCKLDGVSPVTLAPNPEFVWSMRKTHLWDSAANTFIEEITKGQSTWINKVGKDVDGISFMVELYIKDDGNFININKKLIEKGFATKLKKEEETKKSADEILLEKLLEEKSEESNFPVKSQKECNIQMVRKNDSSDEKSNLITQMTQKYDQTTKKDNLRFFTTSKNTTRYRNMSSKLELKNEVLDKQNLIRETHQRKKEIEQQKFIDHGNKDCEELLKIIRGEDYVSHSPDKNETSGTSDVSDMETTPVPKLESFRLYKPNNRNVAKLLTEKVGKETSDLISEIYDLEKDSSVSPNKTPKSTKHVSFSPHNEIFDLHSEKDIIPGKSFQFHDDGEKKDISSYISGDGSNILKLLKLENNPFEDSKSRLTLNNPLVDEVIVYGKRKRKPIIAMRELDLPMPLKTSLNHEYNLKTPSPFQAHLWPAVSAFRNIVGIAESNRTMRNEILAFALPILRDIIEQEDTYKKLGPGNGPYMMILVNGWREAQEVYDVFEKLTGYYKSTIRIDIRYGGMDKEAERDVRLVNGCEVLVGTVPSINRSLEHGYTNFNRLCHIVFENADNLVERFTEDIKVFMRSYAHFLEKSKRPELFNQQIIAIGRKWSYGIGSLMNSYINDPLIIINNKIEAALHAKVPIVVELCNSNERMEYLVGILETEALNFNTLVFTNSAKGADTLREKLSDYSVAVQVITEFSSPVEVKDIKHQWNAQFDKKNNVIVISDNAVINANIRNASYLIHYEYPQKKSFFGNRLHCLSDTIRNNEEAESKKKMMCHVFMTEQNNEMKYSTGLVKLLKRSGQEIPELLQSMALSSRELKEEQKEYSELCPRLKLFGECSFLEDCQERHKIFPSKDMLGFCPTTGFVKVLILDVISASNFWGRIIDHRLPYNPKGKSSYDTTIFMKLALDLQSFYSDSNNRKQCISLSVYDICVTHSKLNGFQRVRIERIIEKDNERPITLEVFGIDNGLKFDVNCNGLLVCDEQFKRIPHQAVEIITCCIKPVENGDSWTHEASYEMEHCLVGKTLEGRIQFSLQNTVWVDPLVEKEVLTGVQTKTFSLDVGRDLIGKGYASKNVKHVGNLRKLLYDVLGKPLEKEDDKNSLPPSMIDHECSYLQDDDYEDVYISAVVNPGLFFIQRAENCDMIEQLDDKIDATMKVKKLDDGDYVFPIGYICVAKFSIDGRWYRARIVDMNDKQYEVFYVDHGDREWVKKKYVSNSWDDILTPAYQAIECSFQGITPMTSEWKEEDGDTFWDFVKDRLLAAKVLSTRSSEYLNEAIHFDIELFDTTGDQTINICHQLVYMGIANGQLHCLQTMFPHASVDTSNKIYNNLADRCADICLAIHLEESVDNKMQKVQELRKVIFNIEPDSEIFENGALSSTCKLLALSREEPLQAVLLECFKHFAGFGSEACDEINDNEGVKTICKVLKGLKNESTQLVAVETLILIANNSWYHDAVREHGFIRYASDVLETCLNQDQLVESILDALILFCKGKEVSCDAFRQKDGIRSLCRIYKEANDSRILQKCAELFKIVLTYWRNQEKMREIGGYQVLGSFMKKHLAGKTLKYVLETLLGCIENNVTNRNYLLMIKADQNLKKYSCLPYRFSIEVRKLFAELLDKLKPDEAFSMKENEILPHFNEKRITQNDIVMETKTPTMVWSQRKKTVTLSIKVRGAFSEETKIDGNKLKFRTVFGGIEYVVDIELYANVCGKTSRTIIKGGEILVILQKLDEEIWPRLLESLEKHPCISIDFERWVEDASLNDNTTDYYSDNEGSLFTPGVPRPPPSKYLTNFSQIQVDDPALDSSDTSEKEDEDELLSDEEFLRNDDYFHI